MRCGDAPHPADGIRPPVGAEREIHPQVIAHRAQGQLPVGAHAVQHLELELVGRPATFARHHERAGQPIVMGAEHRQETRRARLWRQHDRGRLQIGRVDARAAAMVQRAHREGPLTRRSEVRWRTAHSRSGKVRRRRACSQARRQAVVQQFPMQRAGTLADAVVLHVQHHPVAPPPAAAAPPTRCAAHCRGPARRCARSRWRWDQSTHASRPAASSARQAATVCPTVCSMMAGSATYSPR